MTEYRTKDQLAHVGTTADTFDRKTSDLAVRLDASDFIDMNDCIRRAHAERSKAACAMFRAIGRSVKRLFAGGAKDRAQTANVNNYPYFMPF